ncbi:fasciclin domain-containing protein [Corynebacterium sp. J010B-136]|uniref:fasciclin domain-containing protein n=1 Tax=Corynebacterium sp. J010B-136 TaxID=2099401 RepID=UPI000CF929B3|nr:fasciclin domain-containing protein [Corynebacterium sp. J010B-136]PQM75794.1 fasciclin [Corynebacterium sp. J010B-136]
MKRLIAAGGAITLALTLGACATDDSDMATETMTDEATATNETTTEETTTEETEAAAPEGDIVDTAVAAGQFTTLTSALESAGLVETLQGEGPFTVFAPTDDAFAALPDGTVDELMADPTGDLAEILQYHVIADEVWAADVMEMDGQMVETVQGTELTVEVDGENVSLVDAAGNSVNVTDTDIESTNGVIHVIDGVLMPTT